MNLHGIPTELLNLELLERAILKTEGNLNAANKTVRDLHDKRLRQQI